MCITTALWPDSPLVKIVREIDSVVDPSIL